MKARKLIVALCLGLGLALSQAASAELQVVARTVVAVLMELRAEAVEGAAVEARDDAVDDATRQEVEVADAGEDCRVAEQPFRVRHDPSSQECCRGVG